MINIFKSITVYYEFITFQKMKTTTQSKAFHNKCLPLLS